MHELLARIRSPQGAADKRAAQNTLVRRLTDQVGPTSLRYLRQGITKEKARGQTLHWASQYAWAVLDVMPTIMTFLGETVDAAMDAWHPESKPDPAATTTNGKPGPPRDYETALRVEGIVRRVAGAAHWTPYLDEIRKALDTDKVRTPRRWGCSWSMADRELARKTINHHLQNAKRSRS